MIRNMNISQLILNYRSVFVAAASAILEGEQDYSEQTFATPTLQRSHFLHGVVNLILVRVKAQCVKREVLNEKQKRRLYNQQKRICCTSLFCDGEDRIPLN